MAEFLSPAYIEDNAWTFILICIFVIVAYRYYRKHRKEAEMDRKGIAEVGYAKWFAGKLIHKFKAKTFMRKNAIEIESLVQRYIISKKLPTEYDAYEITNEIEKQLKKTKSSCLDFHSDEIIEYFGKERFEYKSFEETERFIRDNYTKVYKISMDGYDEKDIAVALIKKIS